MVPIEVQLPTTRGESVAVRAASIDVVVGEVTLRIGADTDVEYVGALVAALLRAKS